MRKSRKRDLRGRASKGDDPSALPAHPSRLAQVSAHLRTTGRSWRMAKNHTGKLSCMRFGIPAVLFFSIASAPATQRLVECGMITSPEDDALTLRASSS